MDKLVILCFAMCVALCAATMQTDEVAVFSVPHKDQEFYSLTVAKGDTSNDDFYKLTYDASSFVPSSAPYGLPDPQNRWECPHNKLSEIAPTSQDLWPANHDLFLRRMLDLPAGVSTLEIKITAHQSTIVYLNGQAVSGSSSSPLVTPGGLCASQDNVVFNVPDRFVRTGPNLLAIRVNGATELNYFDIQIRTFYPRPTGIAGNVFTWGKGYYGVLGNGYEEDSFVPGRILDIKELKNQPIKHVSLGVAHSLLLTESGLVYTWGRGKEMQLGMNEEYMEIPVAATNVNILGKIQAVATGSLHNLVLDEAGRVYCYGDNTASQCGLGLGVSETHITDPQRVSVIDNEVVVLIGAKDTFNVAVTNQGRVYTWGNTVTKSPHYIGVLNGITSLSVGSSHVLLLTNQGTVYSFGIGSEGQLGLKSGALQSDTLSEVESLSSLAIHKIIAGTDNSFAITQEGKVYVWGSGSFGKNGLGVWSSQFVPVQITSLSDHKIRSIGAGMTSTLFLDDKGQVFVSGSNLRDGSHTLSPRLWASASDKYFVKVYASHLHFAALTGPSKWDWTKVENYYQGTMKP